MAALVLLAGALPAGADEEAPADPSPTAAEPSPEPDPTPGEKEDGPKSPEPDPEPTISPGESDDPQPEPPSKNGGRPADEPAATDGPITPLAVGEPVDDAYTITSGSLLFRLAPSVVANDPTGSTVVSHTQPEHGSVTNYLSTTELYYTADAGYSGPDSFTYTTEGGTATVDIEVAANANRPVDDHVTVPANTSFNPLNLLANDPAGSTLSFFSTQPSHGTAILLDDDAGYTPTPGYTGPDTFTYNTQFGTATVHVTVTANTSQPVDDSYTVAANSQNTVLTPHVLANDPAGSTLLYFATNPSHGSVLQLDGQVTYTPTPGYTGPDSFTYATQFGVATVSLTVGTTIPPAPVPADDTYSVGHDATLTVSALNGVLRNDENADTVTVGTNVAHGSLNLSTDGGFTYTPASGYYGADSFTYTATGPGGTSAPATVRLSISPPGAPTTTADAYSTNEGDLLTVSAAEGLLKNDGGVISSIVVASEVSHGTLKVDDDGSFTYQPEDGFSGTDTFTYTATGPGGTSAPTTVTITVEPAPVGPPVADDDTYLLEEFTDQLTVSAPGVLQNDSNTTGATASVATQPASGTVELNQDGGFVYRRTADLPVEDSFTYRLTGPGGTSETATVSLTLPPNPVDANDDSYEVEQGDELSVAAPGFLGNDDLAGGTPLVLAIRQQTTHGTVVLSGYGGFSYTPDPDFTGVDTFEYVIVTNEPLGFDTATVTITVDEPDLTPIAVDDSYDVIEEETLVVDEPGVIGNDPGATGARLLSNPAHGSLDLNGDGSFTYTPDDDFTGTDEFTYVATNDVEVRQGGQSLGGGFLTLDSAPANVTLNVIASSDDDDDSDDDDGSGGAGDGDDGEDSNDDQAALPDAGSPVRPAELTLAVLLTLLGAMLLGVTRRRGRHTA
jgi:hypothetical protein